MKLRLGLVAVLVAAVAIVLGRNLPIQNWMGQARQASTSEPAPAIELFPPLPPDSALKLDVLRERQLAPYRLRPDRRLVLAIAEVRRMAGAPDSAVTAQFTGGRWTLRCGSQQVGTLSELPDFPEMLEVTTEWARKQAWAKGWSDNAGPERPDLARALERVDAPAALREADRVWATGARDAALFRAAARAYALLALETPGLASMADPIAARALAALSFARALGAEDPRREGCLLAEVMGYSAAAADLARRLPAKDPVRLYVNWDDAELARLAATALEPPAAPVSAAAKKPAAKLAAKPAAAKPAPKPATAAKRAAAKSGTTAATVRLEAPFFHLLRLANRGDYETWSGVEKGLEQRGVPSRLVLASGLRIPNPETCRLVAEKLLQATGTPRSTRPKPGTSGNLAQQIQRAEAALEARTLPKGAALFGADFARAQERAVVYAALDRVAQHALESLGPAEMSRWFAPGSRRAPGGKRAVAVERWYSHLAQARIGRADIAALSADVDSAAPGSAEALRSYDALRINLADDSDIRDAARDLVRSMDSRPEHQVQVANIAERDLLALSLADRLEASATTLQGASDSDQAPASGASLPDSILGLSLARKLAADPAAWEAAGRYAAWLEEHKKYGDARRVIERWMTRSPEDTGWTAVNIAAQTQLAHLHQLEGHAAQALRQLGDLHQSGQFAAMERTALVLQDLGQPHQALAIAWAAHRAQPQLAAGRALLAELFWRQARYEEAAKALRDGKLELSGEAWTREVAPRFVAFFATRAPEGLEAATALLRAGFDDRATFGAIPEALGAAGLHTFAFELQSRVRVTGIDRVESALLAYGHLDRAKGPEEALRWIQFQVPEKDRELLCVLAYQERHPELLWSMPPLKMEGEHGDYQWLLRAATCMKAGTSHQRYAETLKQLDRARGTYHLAIARFLLGLSEESDVLARVQNARQRSETYYFIGLKDEQSGRYRDAADWYLMSLEAGETNNIESRWAMQRLRVWARDGMPPDREAPAQAPPA